MDDWAKMCMDGRLGNVLKRTACLLAVILVGSAVYLWNYEVPPKNVFDGLLFLTIATLYWLLGLAIRHALATQDHDMR